MYLNVKVFNKKSLLLFLKSFNSNLNVQIQQNFNCCILDKKMLNMCVL